MTSHPPEPQLIDLASGLLTDEEAHEIMQHVRTCPECEARLRALVADRESARSGPVPVLIDGWIQLVGHRRKPKILIPATVAAALVAIVAFGIFQLTHRNVAPEYWIPVSQETNVLRGSEHNGVAAALRAYQDRDAATAVKELQALQPPADNPSTLRDLYLASALINAGRANEGLEVLDRHDIQSIPTPWRYEAEWVKYIGLRRADRDDEAQSWLEKLSAEPGPNSARVRAEMKRRND